MSIYLQSTVFFCGNELLPIDHVDGIILAHPPLSGSGTISPEK